MTLAQRSREGEHIAHGQVDVAGHHDQRQAEGDDAGIDLWRKITHEVRGGDKDIPALPLLIGRIISKITMVISMAEERSCRSRRNFDQTT